MQGRVRDVYDNSTGSEPSLVQVLLDRLGLHVEVQGCICHMCMYMRV